VIEPIETKYDGVIGQWDRNGISTGDRETVKLAYGTSRTIYVQPDHPGEGSGTLEYPYGDLARARRDGPENSRLILFSTNGVWSVADKLPTAEQNNPKR
jgi:hypothetical protein